MSIMKNLLKKTLPVVLCLSMILGTNSVLAAEVAQKKDPAGKPEKGEPAGQVVNITIPAPSIAKNVIGEPGKRDAAVYLPPSYAKGNKEYPVVYLLPGFGDDYMSFVNGGYNNFKLKESMDTLINSHEIKEMIVVIPDGFNTYVGSFYANSPLTGNWEDFVVKDMVKYVDFTFRTIEKPEARGITGHSMGGFGALNAAMKHPDVFGSVYAMSPGLLKSAESLKTTPMFGDEATIKEFLDARESYKGKPLAEARKEFMDNLTAFKYSFNFVMTVAYGAAFCPDANEAIPVKYPYSLKDGKIEVNEEILNQWYNGFGSIESKVPTYTENLRKLKAVGIEYGMLEDNVWIPEGCESLATALKKAHIPCTLSTFEGGHQELLGDRIENAMLPFFSKNLKSN